MPWASAASDRIHASVRPAIGIPRKASGTLNSSSKASVMARRPAPPVSTSVPSMSNRTSVVTKRPSAFAADVARSGALRRWLFVERHPLTFIQLVEIALDRAPVKEPLLPAVVANEPEPPVTHESLDRSGRHRVSFGAHVCPLRVYQYPFQSKSCGFRPVSGRGARNVHIET